MLYRIFSCQYSCSINDQTWSNIIYLPWFGATKLNLKNLSLSIVALSFPLFLHSFFFYCLSHLWKLLQCQILVNFNEIDQMQIVTKNLCEPFCRGQKNTKMCQPKEEYPYHILKWSGSKCPYPILNWGDGTIFDLLPGGWGNSYYKISTAQCLY